ncbi:MAG: hypothetical protein HYW07_01695 [Candidatus Latescibacteria bacterium]|nr:hypothetical protein [Candidatus Latescibacterota bacterium]
MLVVSFGAPYSLWLVGSVEPTWSFFPVIAGCPFALLCLGNALLRRLAGRWALCQGELLVVLVMGLVVTGIPVFMVGTLIALLASPYYAATPENDWAFYIQPHLPAWALPQPEGEALRWFWEGLPADQGMPLGVWLGPLCWWLSLILAVYFACLCLVVILRRQWVEQERLIFPLTEMPRLLIEEGRWFRSSPFWIGGAISLGLVLFNIFSFFNPGLPRADIWSGLSFQFGRDFPAIQLRVIPPILGFIFLASTSISFSIWFFYLIAVAQEGITNRIGYDVTSPDAFVWGMQSLSWQGWGAFVAMVLWSLWVGRRHLRAVVRQAFSGKRTLDDRTEMMSYRVAVWGLLLSTLYSLAWLVRSGMGLQVALLFLAGVLIGYTGITRLVVQTGMYYLTTPVGGQAFAIAVTGTGVGQANLVSLGLSYAWFGDVQSVFMPSAAHAAKLDEVIDARRWLGPLLGLAVVVGFAVTIWFVLYLCYEYGAGNLRSWYFAAGGGIGEMAFGGVIRKFNNPAGTDWGKLMYSGIGALVYSVLALCQYRFHWWPLHPVGLVVAPLWMTGLGAVSVFCAWALKSLILRYRGVAGYQAARPFFVGLIVGFFTGAGISFGVDVFWFFGKGHGVPW